MSNVRWDFTGRSVLVTGASRGIGSAVATLFANAGAHVFAASRAASNDGHPAVVHVDTDVTDTASIRSAAAAAAKATGRIDICVANAGIGLVEDFSTADVGDWQRLIDVNLVGVMRLWQAVLPYMAGDGRGGRLIATSSAAGIRGEEATPTYSATKAALGGLVQSLAVEYARVGITVNAAAPGEIDTDLNAKGRDRFAERVGRASEDLLVDLLQTGIPMGRLGAPHEVASLVAYLAADEAAYVTGQTVIIDGGQLLR